MLTPPNEQAPRKWRADAALAGIAFVWGATFVLVKGALVDVSPLLFLTIRFLIAAALIAFLFLQRHGASVNGRPWVGGIVTGLFLYTGYAFQTVGLRYTTAAKSAFITGLSIVLVPFLSAIVYRRVPRIFEVVGAVIATMGLVLLTWTGDVLHINLGDLLTVVCAFAFAFHIVLVGHFSGKMDYEWLALLQIGASAVAGLATFAVLESPYLRPSGPVWLALGVTSVLATALAFSVQAWAQRFTTATRAALIFALEPVFAWATSFLVADEVLSLRAVWGAVLILAGILLVELKPIGHQRHPNTQTE